MSRIHVIHENEEWFAPLKEALDHYGLDYGDVFMGEGSFVDLSGAPGPGVYYNRMSASSWTREHAAAPQLTLAFLENAAANDIRVVNAPRALDLEISKARQSVLLERFGIRVPQSALAAGPKGIAAAARGFDGPVILKPDCGGKGAGVALFETPQALIDHVQSEAFSFGNATPMLVQAYIKPAEPFIIRNEFVGGRHLYSVRVDTSDGFQLCPADACEIGEAACPAGEAAEAPGKFTILTGFTHPDIPVFERMLAEQGIEIAGIEFLFDDDGRASTYDININTNYNGQAEIEAGIAGTQRAGMRAVAAHLGRVSGQLAARLEAAE